VTSTSGATSSGWFLSSSHTCRGPEANVPRNDVYAMDSKNGATLLSVIGGHAISAVQSVLGRMEEVGAVLSRRRQTVRVIETGEMIPMRKPDPLVLDAVLHSGAPLLFQLRGGLPRNRRVRRSRQTRASCLMPSLSPCGWASD
jgi:hypothetical protein